MEGHPRVPRGSQLAAMPTWPLAPSASLPLTLLWASALLHSQLLVLRHPLPSCLALGTIPRPGQFMDSTPLPAVIGLGTGM